MGNMGAIIAGAAAALTAAAIVSGLVAWAGPVDRPRERGSHKTPTPTSGGLGIIAGTGLGLWVFNTLAPNPSIELVKLAVAFGLAAALGLIGAVDDLLDLGAKTKLLAQISIALLFAALVAHIEAIPLWGAHSLALGPILGGRRNRSVAGGGDQCGQFYGRGQRPCARGHMHRAYRSRLSRLRGRRSRP